MNRFDSLPVIGHACSATHLRHFFRSGALVAFMTTGCSASIHYNYKDYEQAYYDHPSESGCRKDVVTDFGADKASGRDQNERFQNAINAVAECADGVGGILAVPSGEYFLRGIKLKSNVHLQVDEQVVFHSADDIKDRSRSIFELGMDVNNAVRNVSIIGTGTGFTFDLTTGGAREAAIHVGNARNFKLSNFTIKDKKTILSSISFRVVVGPENRVNWAQDGIVTKARQLGADVGYGLIQAHGLKHVLFDRIFSEGGVALRLETDSPPLTATGQGGVSDLDARNVGCRNGLAAVMLSPHMTKNDSVTIRGIQAQSCAFAVRAEPGAVEILGEQGQSRAELKRRVHEQIGQGCTDTIFRRESGKFVAVIKPKCADSAFRAVGLRPGVFGQTSISDVRSQYGEKSQFKISHYKYLSCREREKVCKPEKDRNELRGGSISTIYDHAAGKKPGQYVITTRDVQASGYPVQNRFFTTSQSQPVVCPDTPAQEFPICHD